MKVVPALLTDSEEELQRMVSLCEQFTNHVQIDIMDGQFVASRSIPVSSLGDLKATAAYLEVHLMVVDPLSAIEPCENAGVRKCIFHIEAVDNPERIISEMKDSGFSVGVALNPKTSVDRIAGLCEQLDDVLLMTVEPGYYGSPFVPEVLDKIPALREQCPNVEISLDGGINASTILQVKQYRPDIVCVGSAVMKAADPAKAFRELQAQVRE